MSVESAAKLTLLACQPLDVGTTGVVLALGGYEANPVAAAFLSAPVVGLVALLVVKLALALLAMRFRVDGRLDMAVIVGAALLYLGAVGWNVATIVQALGRA